VVVRDPIPAGGRRKITWPKTALALSLTSWVACSVYEPSMLTGPDGQGGAASSGASGGLGGKGSGGGGASGGTAGSVAAGSGGSSGATSGTGGSGAGGKGGVGGGGAGGASGGKGGVSGTGGVAGTSGTGTSGTAGTSSPEGGEGGAVDPCPGGDCCPTDDMKTDPGQCGCGVADTDTDADLTADCSDGCPADAAKTAPGECGCGVVGIDADCGALKASLVHRYSFSGTGTTITDSKGTADGTAMGVGVALSGGVLPLGGGMPPANDANKQYVQLPTACLTGLVDATFEAWVTWSTTCAPSGCTNRAEWQRIFDFGIASTGTTGSNIFLTTRANADGPVRSAATTTGANNEIATGFRLDGTLITAGPRHFALVVDDTANQVRLYVDGAQLSTTAYTAVLSSIVATNCWLGRSNYTSDAYFNGSFDEFRIYNAPLSTSAITQSFASGPDAPYL